MILVYREGDIYIYKHTQAQQEEEEQDEEEETWMGWTQFDLDAHLAYIHPSIGPNPVIFHVTPPPIQPRLTHTSNLNARVSAPPKCTLFLLKLNAHFWSLCIKHIKM